jgi:hypothetical protein
MVRLVLLFGPLLSLLSMATSGTARLRGDHEDEADAGVADAHAVAHGDDDPDRGFRNFGRMVEKVTILGVLIMALLVVGLILSLFGVFESDVWDPPV